ncbi:MAG: hypothetical protein Q4D06_03280 [Coriobacteriia bacterium]|nr:hypothetical protein [Coriobacteriia bacterium]
MKMEVNLQDDAIALPCDGCADGFRIARNDSIKELFPSYPFLEFKEFRVEYKVGKAPNAYLAYVVLDAVPDKCVVVDDSRVALLFDDFSLFLEHYSTLVDLISIVGRWKSFSMALNSVEIDWLMFRYLASFWEDRDGITLPVRRSSILDIKRRYVSKPRASKMGSNAESLPRIYLSKNAVGEVARSVSERFEELYLQAFEYKKMNIDPHSVVFEVEDSLVVSVTTYVEEHSARGSVGRTARRYDGRGDVSWCFCVVQEHTPNQLYKFNYAGFRRNFSCDYCSVDFLKYRGFRYYCKYGSYNAGTDSTDWLLRECPELAIREKCEDYQGDLYHCVVFEMESKSGSIERGFGFTRNKVHTFVQRVCNDLETKNSASLRANGANGLNSRMSRGFIEAFLSWKGKRKRWRLEDKLEYFYFDFYCKDEGDLSYRLPNEIAAKLCGGAYDECDRGTYVKPVNRWKTEEYVLNIVKKEYGSLGVVSQFRPHYLKTECGCLSYDIYIAGLKVALEYQGKQHFEPVDYFGGVDSYAMQVERDQLKRQRSVENGVRLIYIGYSEDVTPALVKGKIEAALKEQ